MNIAAKNLSIATEAAAILERLGVDKGAYTGGDIRTFSPVTGEQTGGLKTVTSAEAAAKIDQADDAFRAWRLVPAPKRGELVRLFGEELRAAKSDLGRLVSIEAGKIPSEGLGPKCRK
ncbi:Putative aldehyde dehydrogenase transmembrane protein (fragment) [Mesorhizobium plurifarium]|uniref:Putative aldehyde dehydrogenase transmembrane protein n=1 Tax=Mesorhizobium plurifarium TaxID=69974 RepID=A0A090ED00_MESPL